LLSPVPCPFDEPACPKKSGLLPVACINQWGGAMDIVGSQSQFAFQ
jgi:hypothetical protein